MQILIRTSQTKHENASVNALRVAGASVGGGGRGCRKTQVNISKHLTTPWVSVFANINQS